MLLARAPFTHTRHVRIVPRGPTIVRTASRALVLALLVLLLGCAGDDGETAAASGAGGASGDACPNDLPDRAACDDGVPSYRDEVASILDQRCNACHYADNPQTSAVWTDYDAVYARRRTIQSRIYSCVMPPEEAPQLTPGERAVLLEWLVCGAPEE